VQQDPSEAYPITPGQDVYDAVSAAYKAREPLERAVREPSERAVRESR
jgi:hypothetical protein